MPKKGKGKKGKGKKERQRMKKFDLDLFGLLTFTRYHGAPFEDFMYTPDKFRKGAKGKGGGKGKGGKKGKKKPVEIPKLMKFPPVPENPAKIRKMRMEKKKEDAPPDAIVTTMNLGYPEKTARPKLPLQEGGSIRDVICKKVFPLLPRPQPHGGVYGNVKCILCASTGGLLKTVFGLLHKKMRTLLEKQFSKAQIILEWVISKYEEMKANYAKHIQDIFEDMGPILDNLDEQEFEDHQFVTSWKEEFRKKKEEMLALRMQLKRLRKNREEVVSERLTDKIAEMKAVENEMLALEKRVADAQRMLEDWEQNRDAKINGPKEEIQRLKDLLLKIKNSIKLERDTLRLLFQWERELATAKIVAKMEEIIKADLDEIQSNLHTAWFKLFLENKRMQEERARLRVENHLLDLEVESLTRQVEQMEAYKKDVMSRRTHFITPPSLNHQVDRFFKTGARPQNLELYDYPPTKLILE